VFNRDSRPWINTQGASTEESINQVKKCPSGALHYYLNKVNDDLEKNLSNIKSTIVDNSERSRFETEINGEFSYIDYRFYKGDIALMHTFVPEADRNKGIASALIKFALEYVKEENLKLMVYCPTVAKYIRLHREYEALLDRQYHRVH
jgi:predicted GNAT family acetyltransferase